MSVVPFRSRRHSTLRARRHDGRQNHDPGGAGVGRGSCSVAPLSHLTKEEAHSQGWDHPNRPMEHATKGVSEGFESDQVGGSND